MQVTSPTQLQRYADSVTAAFLRACSDGFQRIGIFDLFVDAATDGRIELDLAAVYRQLVDRYMYRRPYDLARSAAFPIAALNDAACRITPLGQSRLAHRYTLLQACSQHVEELN